MRREVAFLRRDAEIERVDAVIRRIAGARTFLVDRFLFEWHACDATALSPRDLVRAYLTHLGFDASRVDDFPEIPTERALAFVDALWLHDFARREDLLSPEAAATCAQAIRDAVEPWAILAFTNLLEPGSPHYAPERLFGEAYIPVLGKKSAEAGVILMGEEDIAMIWFDDDDSPKRSNWNYGDYERAMLRGHAPRGA